ncbi:MAG: 16S rRNA (cytidine(1402)-2'-O)-methyltransferase [Syntrophomonadaceae bacterium]|nr:16S rRNA (cytidine(1402)-2'-O)-methyltransferase [Syntrophomonadaceae bacterium]
MGTLYVCATPIGNLEDASYRLIRILNEVDLIACEDTRRTRILLQHYQIDKPTISYFQHNQRSREDLLLERLKKGDSIALVSDAGMPGISDPGHLLIERACNEGIAVEVIPGPSALISALVISGLDTSSFVFEGFLPSRAGQRRKKLQSMAQEERTIVLYESPHRLLSLLQDMQEVWGNRRVAVARELTKIHEEVKRGLISEVISHYEEHPPRGEITVVVEGYKKEGTPDLDRICDEVMQLIEQGMEKKEALSQKAREYSVKKSDLYNRLFKM